MQNFYTIAVAVAILLSAGQAINNDPECQPPTAFPFNYPDPLDCRNFYTCLNGNSILYQCPALKEFDVCKRICYPDAIAESYCKSSTSCTSPTPSPTPDPTTPPPPSPCPCCNEFPEYYPHPTCDNKFYECKWGNGILMRCPTGLVFNEIISVCDFPQPGQVPNIC